MNLNKEHVNKIINGTFDEILGEVIPNLNHYINSKNEDIKELILPFTTKNGSSIFMVLGVEMLKKNTLNFYLNVDTNPRIVDKFGYSFEYVLPNTREEVINSIKTLPMLIKDYYFIKMKLTDTIYNLIESN